MTEGIKEVFVNKIASLLNLETDGGSDTIASVLKKEIMEDLNKIFTDEEKHHKAYFKPNHWYWMMWHNQIMKGHIKGADMSMTIDEHGHAMKENINYLLQLSNKDKTYLTVRKDELFESKEALLKSLGVEVCTDDTQFAYYQQIASSTKFYGKGDPIVYPALKLNGEAGEVAEKIGKILRDKDGKYSHEAKLEIIKELGDVLWYITATATDLGFNLSDVAKMNMEKILSRKERNKISGSGDNR